MDAQTQRKEKTVFCPIKQGQVNGTDCILICDVADKMVKPNLLPEGMEWNETKRKMCQECQYHNDIYPSTLQ